MLNQIILVGRIAQDLEIKGQERKNVTLILDVPRNFKNADGNYDTDFIPCVLFGNIAENTVNYCKKGDTIEIKGRLQNVSNNLEIIAEKVTFLSNNVNKESEEKNV